MAAPIITCPACTKKFKGKEGIEGKRIKCPLCATPFVVPAAGQAKGGNNPAKDDGTIQLKKDEPAKTQAQNAASWNAEDNDANPYGLGQFDERPRCPNCANLLEDAKSVICLFCGYNTMTREWGKTKKTISITGGQHFAHLLPGIFFLLLLVTFVVGIMFFALELPPLVAGTWARFFDHESMRMWINGIALGFMWAFGMLAFKRLVINPKPQEVVKD